MYKLIFADDEPLIRKNIEKIVPWTAYGYELIGCCENGHELLEMIEREVPDLVITDIDMPFVSGIEVAKQVKQMYPRTKIVFLTGYNEFEYAKKAIDFSVIRYILKPITAQEIKKVLSEIKEVLDEEFNRNNDINNLKNFYKKNIVLMQNVFLNKLLTMKEDKDTLELRLETLELHRLKSNRFQVAALVFDPGDKPNEWKEHEELQKFAVYNIIKEILEERNIGYAVVKDNCINFILCSGSHNTENYEDEFVQTLEEVLFCIEKYLGFTVNIGVGGIIHDLESIYVSNEEALAALGYRKIAGNNRLIYIKDIEPHRTRGQSFEFDYVRKLLNVIKIGKVEDLEHVYKDMIQNLEQEKFTIEQTRFFLITLAFNLLKEASRMGLDITSIFEINKLKNLFDILEYQEIYETLYALCLKLLHSISNSRKNNYSAIVDQAIQMIEQDYKNSQLSLDVVCMSLHLSSSYFRAIFKKETGKTFGNYLTNIRMEKAKELMMTTKMKNYEIASATGYMDAHYFSYCFKKYYDMSPNDMRSTLN